MKRFSQCVVIFVAFCGGLSSGLVFATEANELTNKERQEGFELLFNGRNLQGWLHEGNWTTDEGAIVSVSRGGNLVHQATTIRGDFELRFEWKVAKRGNGLPSEPEDSHPDSLFFTEFRIPHSVVDSDGQQRLWGQMGYLYATAGGAVGLFSKEIPLGSSADAVKGMTFSRGPRRMTSHPVGQWNGSRIIWQGKRIQHWLNGVKVIDTELSCPGGVPEEAKQMMERLQVLSAQLRSQGLHIEIENQDSLLRYRGIKLRNGKGVRESAGQREAKRGIEAKRG